VEHEPPVQGTLKIDRDPAAASTGPPTFSLSGELDLSNAGHLVEAIQPFAISGGEVILRLGRLDFMDSSGMRALLQIAQALGPGGRLVIHSPSPAVAKVLEIVGANQFPGFAIVDA